MFFSVKQPIKIAGKEYTPCVCYPVPRFLEYTVEQLAKEEKVALYSKRVFFQNGKVIEDTPVAEPAPAPVMEAKPKKAKKEKAIEEVPSPEEVADDLGGF